MVSLTFIFMTTVLCTACLPNSVRLLCRTTAAQLQEPNVMKIWATSYGDSITDLKPHFQCCLKKCYSKVPIAVYIDFHMYPVFLIRLVSALRIMVHHWTNLRTPLVPVSKASVGIQPTLKSSRSNKPKHAFLLVRWEKRADATCCDV